MLSFSLSFLKEVLSTTKTKLTINGRNWLASFFKMLMVLTGEFTTAIVLGIPITRELIQRAISVTIAVYLASIITLLVFKKTEGDKPYEFLVKFINHSTRQSVMAELTEQEIHCTTKGHRTLIINTYTRYDSKIVKDLIDNKYVRCNINALEEIYIKLDVDKD